MELRSPMHLLGALLFLFGVIIPFLMGLFADKIVGTRIYGRLPDAIIALLGGCIPAYIVYKLTNTNALDFSQPLATIERADDISTAREGAIFCVVAIVCALVVLFVLRQFAGRKRG